MPRKRKQLFTLFIGIFIMGSIGAAHYTLYGGRCNPNGTCYACKNCKYCKHCKGGGKCSVCK